MEEEFSSEMPSARVQTADSQQGALQRCATSRAVEDSILDDVIRFSAHLVLPATPGPEAYSVPNRNE